MAIKRVICADRVRQVPTQFSWVDHRLVRDHYIERCDVYAAALYLFLVTVADGQGLSYYADASLARKLSMTPGRSASRRADRLRPPALSSAGAGLARAYNRRAGDPGEAWPVTRSTGEPVMIDYQTFCQIKDLHERQHLTVAQTARALGLPPHTVATWANTAQYRPRPSAPRGKPPGPLQEAGGALAGGASV